MKTEEFHYPLPRHLIAHHPAPVRTTSRLLQLGADGRLHDGQFEDLLRLLRPDDLLVVNDSKVIPARLHARKISGGKVEILIERVLQPQRALAQLRSNRPLQENTVLQAGREYRLTVAGRDRGLFVLTLNGGCFEGLLRDHGEVPLPPYIERRPGKFDAARYQTVYAKQPGSVAAPTAGLHFDRALLDRIRADGVAIAALTLHVGAGTFQPLRSDTLEAHVMYREILHADVALCRAVAACRERGGRVVAVGTTVVRGLETMMLNDGLHPFCGETDLFIKPGFRFRTVDVMLTNFHLPETTLFVLVCAFAGRARMMRAYRHAAAHNYRFFSYGDANWIEKNDAL